MPPYIGKQIKCSWSTLSQRENLRQNMMVRLRARRRKHRSRPYEVRHALASPDEGCADRPVHRQVARGPAVVGAFWNRRRREVSRHRDRRCDRDRREDRYLITDAVPSTPDVGGGALRVADCASLDVGFCIGPARWLTADKAVPSANEQARRRATRIPGDRGGTDTRQAGHNRKRQAAYGCREYPSTKLRADCRSFTKCWKPSLRSSSSGRRKRYDG